MGFKLISAIVLLNDVNPGSLPVHLSELVCQLSDSNVRQSLSGTTAVLAPRLSARIPAALMFPLKLGETPSDSMLNTLITKSVLTKTLRAKTHWKQLTTVKPFPRIVFTERTHPDALTFWK